MTELLVKTDPGHDGAAQLGGMTDAHCELCVELKCDVPWEPCRRAATFVSMRRDSRKLEEWRRGV